MKSRGPWGRTSSTGSPRRKLRAGWRQRARTSSARRRRALSGGGCWGLFRGPDLEHGLTSAEAARRLAAEGPNELRSAPPVPIWRRVLAQFQDPIIYLLLAAIAISLVVWVIEGQVGLPVDAIVIMLIVVINAVLGYAQEAKAENAVAALAQMTAVTSTVMRDGQVTRVPSTELVRGDVLVLGEGDSVGADARLAQAASLRVH